LVSKAFTPRLVQELEGRVAELCHHLLCELSDAEEVDLVDAFTYPLPVLVISELLGLPASDREDLKRWSDDVALLLDPFPAPEAVERFTRSLEEFEAYLHQQFEWRRRHRDVDDLIAGLAAARDVADALSDAELISMVVLLVAAGHETTTNLWGNAVVILTKYPDHRRRLVEDPALARNAVEEILRYDSPVQRTSRVATEPLQVGGTELRVGDLAFLLLGAANRDPALFSEPDRLDLRRTNARDHLAFGHGIHFCLGAPLARLEGRVGLPSLYRRFPDLAADVDAVHWRSSIVLRGPEKLPVRLS
jgi:cytochrome P450